MSRDRGNQPDTEGNWGPHGDSVFGYKNLWKIFKSKYGISSEEEAWEKFREQYKVPDHTDKPESDE